MDVDAAVRDGITFFTHKATEGTTIRHVHYGEALNRARAAGMPLMGAYMVVRTPGNNGHGAVPAQVDYALAYLDSQTPWWRTTPEFFIQVDTEHWGYDDVAPQYGVTACSLLRARTGKWVVLYAPRWAYGDGIPGNDPLWASSYGANPAVPYRQAYPGDGSSGWASYSGRTPTILQYGSRLTIGTQPYCDADAFRGTVAQMRALITGVDMDAVQNYRLKLLFENWDPTRDQWVAAGGDPAVWDAANAAGGARNGVKQTFNSFNDSFDTLNGKVDALDSAVHAIGAPTQDQVNTAVLNAMLDPRVQQGIGDAIASHLHVS
ncbi:hypothetical protein HC031_14290 [Planosporangium thailandense]|uniref:Uncharacterized protein n=2 Tax=Planosporangium thailandense TaxID=765197 RepID=A0ABX0XXX2_9ACTN|nr:hypothetical protein [Planosporangium thailandense]